MRYRRRPHRWRTRSPARRSAAESPPAAGGPRRGRDCAVARRGRGVPGRRDGGPTTERTSGSERRRTRRTTWPDRGRGSGTTVSCDYGGCRGQSVVPTNFRLDRTRDGRTPGVSVLGATLGDETAPKRKFTSTTLDAGGSSCPLRTSTAAGLGQQLPHAIPAGFAAASTVGAAPTGSASGDFPDDVVQVWKRALTGQPTRRYPR